MEEKHWYLYVLRLESGKWYVGISTNIEKRFKQHWVGFAGAAWTKVYKPIEIHYRQDLGVCSTDRAQLFEGRVTRKYMEEYGDNNVRGGDLTDTNPYVKRFGYFWPEFTWQVTLYILFLWLVIIALLLDKYL